MTNTVISKMVDGQEKGVKQVLQSPTRAKGKLVNNTQRYQKASSSYRSPRSSPQFESIWDTNCRSPPQKVAVLDTSCRSPPQKVGRCSPSKGGGVRIARSPRLSPSHGELYAGFSDSPEPDSLPQPPSHWIFPILLEAQA